MCFFFAHSPTHCVVTTHTGRGRALLEHHLRVMLPHTSGRARCHAARRAHPHRGQTQKLRSAHAGRAETPLSPDPPLSRTVRRAARRVHTTAHFLIFCARPSSYCMYWSYLQSGERVSGHAHRIHDRISLTRPVCRVHVVILLRPTSVRLRDATYCRG